MQSNYSIQYDQPPKTALEYLQQGQFKEARELVQVQIEDYLQAFGHHNPQCSEYADLLMSIGKIYSCEGNYQSAIESFMKGYKIYLKLKGNNNPKTQQAVNQMKECQDQAQKSASKSRFYHNQSEGTIQRRRKVLSFTFE